MGINIFARSSSFRAEQNCPAPTDPNPELFIINEMKINGEYILASINYKNCVNFESEKIILFKEMTERELYDQIEIDPHFLENNKVLARFRPDKQGKELAIRTLFSL